MTTPPQKPLSEEQRQKALEAARERLAMPSRFNTGREEEYARALDATDAQLQKARAIIDLLRSAFAHEKDGQHAKAQRLYDAAADSGSER